jgi:hypothetical protein
MRMLVTVFLYHSFFEVTPMRTFALFSKEFDMLTQMEEKLVAAGVAVPKLESESPKGEIKAPIIPVSASVVKASSTEESCDDASRQHNKTSDKHVREQSNKEKRSMNGNGSHLVIPQLRVSVGHKPRAYAPHGTIQPGQLFTLNAYLMGDVARKIAGLGQHPEVLLYTPRDTGYDVLRIAVMVKGGGKKAFLAITSATGSYAEKFGGYIGENIFLDELGGRSEVPPNRAERTKAVHEVLSQVIEKIQSSRK